MDKRAWITAIVGILLPFGIVYVVNFPPLSIASGGGPAKLCRIASVVMIIFVTPILLTIIAKRRPFLWGVTPYLIVISCAFLWAFHVMRHFKVSPDASHAILAYTCIAIAISGIGVGIRWIIRANARKRSLTETNAPYSVDPNAWPPQPK